MKEEIKHVTEHAETERKQLAALRRSTPVEEEWNIRELLERVDEDQEFFCELLRIFQEDSRTNLRKAMAAQGAGDLPELMRAAHTLKGMLRNLSMNRAAEAAYALEKASREGKRMEAEKFLAQLEQALSELLPEVDAQLAEMRT